MSKTTKILIGVLAIVLGLQTALLFNLLKSVNNTFTGMTHGHAFMSEKIDVLTGKVNELENKLDRDTPPPSEDTGLTEVNISGYFTATVRDVIPDYTFDDSTPMVAVVTCFQSTPFTVWLGEELASQVKVGETYNFEIIEKEITMDQESVGKALPSPETAIPLYNLRIASVSIAGEEDYGLDTYHFVVK